MLGVVQVRAGLVGGIDGRMLWEFRPVQGYYGYFDYFWSSMMHSDSISVYNKTYTTTK